MDKLKEFFADSKVIELIRAYIDLMIRLITSVTDFEYDDVKGIYDEAASAVDKIKGE